MQRRPIAFEALAVRPHDFWSRTWPLLTAGDFPSGKFNTMTVGWGSLGTMWNKPFVQVVVRPTRHTHMFMERFDTFTLCALPEQYRPALQIMGSKSGRDTDKVALTGLTPIASSVVAAPSYDEAELIVECRKIYRDEVKPAGFLLPEIDRNYPQKDYHCIYFGEIVAMTGTDKYAG